MTGALRAAAVLRLPPVAASLTQRGLPRFARFQISLFEKQGTGLPPLGAAPPRPIGREGAVVNCCGAANGFKKMQCATT